MAKQTSDLKVARLLHPFALRNDIVKNVPTEGVITTQYGSKHCNTAKKSTLLMLLFETMIVMYTVMTLVT